MKVTAISIIIAAAMIGGAIVHSDNKKDANTIESPGIDNVGMVDGKQIITIDAKGRYSPPLTTAKADVPTVIQMKTQGTFDCTAALTIPALKYRANLPPSGVTKIEVPPQKSGTTLQGLCAMGMYNFAIHFN